MDTRAGWARARAWPCKVRGGGSFEITIASYNLQISAAMVRRRQDENFLEKSTHFIYERKYARNVMLKGHGYKIMKSDAV